MAHTHDKEKNDSKHPRSFNSSSYKEDKCEKRKRHLSLSTNFNRGLHPSFYDEKMKTEQPEQLAALVTKHIVNVDKPVSVPPKSRAARGSRKRRDQFLFTKQDIERLLTMARAKGIKI